MITVDSSMSATQGPHQVSDRQFGLIVGLILSALGTLPLAWGGEGKQTLWAIAAVLLVLGLVFPALLHWPKTIWFWITGKIGIAVNFLLLSVIFYFVVTPVALFFRLIGRDPLRRHWDKEAASYWVERTGQLESMTNQF